MVMSRVQQIQRTSQAKSDEMGGEIILKSTCAEKQNQLANYQVSWEYLLTSALVINNDLSAWYDLICE